MSASASPDPSESRRALVKRLDVHCDRFEAAWNLAQRPRIEEYLAEVSEPEQPALLKELLALELELIQGRDGRTARLPDYQARFPRHLEAVDAAFAEAASSSGREVSARRIQLAEAPAATGFDSGGEPNDSWNPIDLPTGLACDPQPTPTSELGSDAGWREGWPQTGQSGDSPELERTGLGHPERFGPFRVLDVLGQGGMGIVYRASHAETGRLVAVKSVRLRKPSLLHQIRREIQALGCIRHPGVVQIVQSNLAVGTPWYAMELIEGRPFSDHLRAVREGELSPPDPSAAAEPTINLRAGELQKTRDNDASRMPEVRPLAEPSVAGLAPGTRDVLAMVHRLCQTLAYLHGEGIVHRDLKPQNVAIRPDGTPVLFDFGLASQYGTAGRESLDTREETGGTLAYMAPEQIRGEFVDARADLYALGCILYECTTGSPPFRGKRATALIDAHLYSSPVPPNRLVRGIPAALESLILRLLAKRAQDRLAHAQDVAAVLEEIGVGGGSWGSEWTPRAYLYRPEFTGRREALATLEARVGETLRGGGGGLLIRGESGVGKTRLILELARLAERDGLRVIAGECLPSGNLAAGPRMSPGVRAILRPFRMLLNAIAEYCREQGQAESDRVLGAEAKLLEPFEPALARLPGRAEIATPDDLPPEAAGFRLLNALGVTLSRFTQRVPLVLLLDDLQWADELSLNFLTLFQAGVWDCPGCLVVGTCRSEEDAGNLLRRVGSLEAFPRIELDGFGNEDVGKIARDMLGSDPLDGRFVQFLARKLAGNPFFIAEYLRTAVAEGVLHRDPTSGWRLTGVADAAESESPFEAIPLPHSLGELILRRLAGLPRNTGRLLDVAAVLGREVEGELLSTLCAMDPAELMGALNDLLVRQVLEDGPNGGYRFTHDKLQEILYQQIHETRRRALHGAVAQALEARPGSEGRATDLLTRLVHHWSSAGDDLKALEYLERAGAQALETAAYRQAVESFGQALAIDDRRLGAGAVGVVPARRARWERGLGDATLQLGQVAECRAHMLRAVSLLGHSTPRAPWRLKLGLMGQLGRQVLHRAWPRLFLGRNRELSDHHLEAAGAYDRLMRVAYYQHDTAGMFYAALRSINLAERAGPSSELVAAYASLFGIAGLIPVRRLAETYARLGYEAVAQGHGSRTAHRWLLHMDAIYRLGTGDWTPLLDRLQEATALAQAAGDARNLEDYEATYCTLWTLRGSYHRALHHALTMTDSATRRGDHQSTCLGRLHIAECHLELEQPQEARTALESAVGLAAQSSSLGRIEKTWACSLHASLKLGEGDLAEAAQQADRAAHLIRQGPPIVWYLIHAYGRVAKVHLALLKAAGNAPNRVPRMQLARQSCRVLFQCARVLPVGLGQAWRLWGTFERIEGRENRAQAAWVTGAKLAQGLGLDRDEELCLRELADFLPDGDPCRTDYLTRAGRLRDRTTGGDPISATTGPD